MEKSSRETEGPLAQLKRKYITLFRRLLGAAVRKRGPLLNFVKVVFYVIALPFECVGDLLFAWKRIFPKPLPRDAKKILIVKIDQLGDVLFSTFLLPYLMRAYPRAEIHYLIAERSKPVLEKNPHIKKIFFYGYFSIGALRGRTQEGIFSALIRSVAVAWNTFWALRKEHYDVIVNARPYPPSINWYLWLLNAKRLVAFDVSIFSCVADNLARYDLEVEEYKNFQNLLTSFGVDVSAPPEMQFFNFAEATQVRDKVLSEYAMDIEKNSYIAVTPATFDKERLWATDKWRALFDELSADVDGILIVGISDHRKYLEELTQSGRGKKIKIVDNFSLPEIATLISKSVLLLTIDSLPAFLGVASDVPTIEFVNSEVWFVRGLSALRKLIEARAIIPPAGSLVGLYPISVSPGEVVARAKEFLRS